MLNRICLSVLSAATCWLWMAASSASAHGTDAATTIVNSRYVPAAIAVRSELPPPPAGVEDLKFHEVFRLPAGSLGLEASERLLTLDGRAVRMVGFMVRNSNPGTSSFILAPMPLGFSDEDEAEADDIPANAVLVRLPKSLPTALPNINGLLQISGILRVGHSNDAATDRVFSVAIDLDSKQARSFARLASKAAKAADSPSQRRGNAP